MLPCLVDSVRSGIVDDLEDCMKDTATFVCMCIKELRIRSGKNDQDSR